MSRVFRSPYFLFFFITASLVLAVFWARPPYPIDETRYIGVAWEMWLRQQFILPLMNGLPYSHKPPLLFWLINASWSVFGVNALTPRIIPAVFALAAVLITQKIATRLWPSTQAAKMAPFVLMGSVMWLAWLALIRFDIMLTTWVALSYLCVLLAREKVRGAWLGYGIVLGCGILTKGPVMLLFASMPVIFAPLWVEQSDIFSKTIWYKNYFLALLVGALISLSWALMAAKSGGAAYTKEILWSQSAGRMHQSFAHAKAWWWYFPALIYFIFPWSLWPPVWQGLRNLYTKKFSWQIRFILVTILPSLYLLCLISGKQARYLFPLLPSFVLLAVAALAQVRGQMYKPRALLTIFLLAMGIGLYAIQWPSLNHVVAAHSPWLADTKAWWGAGFIVIGLVYRYFQSDNLFTEVRALCLVMAASVLWQYVTITHARTAYYDLRPIAVKIAQLQSVSVPIAFVGDYEDQFHYFGRLKQGVDVIAKSDITDWLQQHPSGVIASTEAPSPYQQIFSQPYKHGQYYLFRR